MAKVLSNVTDEELEAELARRKSAKTLPIPKPLAEINWESTYNEAVEGINARITKKHQEDDLEHYLFEAVVEAVYGKGIWEIYNKAVG